MRLNLRLLDPRSGRLDPIVLTADPETPMDEVARALGRVQPGELFVRGVPLSPTGPIRAARLLDGDVVTVTGPEARRAAPTGLELAVVGGPLAGTAWPLLPGTVTIGRSRRADVRVDHPTVSRLHCRIQVEGTSCLVEDLGSTNGTWIGGRPLSEPTVLELGQMFEVGTCPLEVRAPHKADADVHPDEAGGLEFNRPARIRPPRVQASVAVPGKPTDRDASPFPWTQVVAPLAIAAPGTVVFGPLALVFALTSAAMSASTNIAGRRREARRAAQESDRYQAELARAQARLLELATQELAEARFQFPDPVALRETATGPTRRLWERRGQDDDASALRVGLAQRAASVVITSRGTGHDAAAQHIIIPVAVDLAEAGVLGIAGPLPAARAVTRWLVTQLATFRSPRDLQLVLLTDAATGEDWEWVRWLPHIRVDDPDAPPALVGNDRSTREERVKELLAVLEARATIAREERVESFTPSVVAIVDGIRSIRAMPGVPRLLREGPAVGLYVIGLDSDVNRLAEEGRAQLVLGAEDPDLATLEVDGREAVERILVDQVDPLWADEVARGLAAIRDTGGEEAEASIPASVRFVDLAGIDLDRPEEVAGRWAGGGRSTEALVGVSVDGPFTLDLKRDGYHALVAGTTGAGKSEFLQTLVASLALSNLPTALNFVLVDYKGASAFADCEHLPHTVGMVTNLDGHLTERALVSLDAEIKRRERLLKDLHVPDLDAAWERNGERAAQLGLARLVIVIDEFAELVRELPEFVTGLIRIARVGRSLGVHLIFATQRPAGVVSPEMRANTGLRVALRMEDKHDSTEVLGAPDAARIPRSTPGRGFVRTGGRAALVEFQTARVAGRRKGETAGLPPPDVEVVPWRRLGYPMRNVRIAEDPVGEATDLHALVGIIARAAADLGLPRPASPWLPPLPALLTLSEVNEPPAEPATGLPPVVFGLEDLPALQAQRRATFDVERGGNLLIAGSARSGRSTALRTLAGSLARSLSPSDLHLYGLDFGNGALLPLADLPHCGGVVVGAGEGDRVERLLGRLADEVARRQDLLARAGLGDIGEQRRAVRPEERLPYLVVLLDRWEGFNVQFSQESGSELPAAVLRLVREGPGVGLRLVIAGDRTLLTDRIASQVEDKLVLRLADRNDYGLANLNPRNLPEEVPPGRAFRADWGTEVQFALLSEDPSGQAQAAALRDIARDSRSRWPPPVRSNRPFRVDALPTSVPFAQAWAMAQPVRPASPLWALIGVGSDELTAFGIDLAMEGAFVVAGPSKSGRSTALACIARSLLAAGARVVAVCPRPSPLAAVDGSGDSFHVVNGVPDGAELAALLAASEGSLAVVVDDAELVARTPADDAIREIARNAPRGRLALVVGGQLEDLKNELRGTIVEARKAKAGLLLSPLSSLDGEVVGLRLSRNLVGRMPPGRGVLGLDGEARVVQVPR